MRVGRIRVRLAALLEEAIPRARFDPKDLRGGWHTPEGARSWWVDGRNRVTGELVYAWGSQTMTQCVQSGIYATQNMYGFWTISPRAGEV